jgi:hypothetical protein
MFYNTQAFHLYYLRYNEYFSVHLKGHWKGAICTEVHTVSMFNPH